MKERRSLFDDAVDDCGYIIIYQRLSTLYLYIVKARVCKIERSSVLGEMLWTKRNLLMLCSDIPRYKIQLKI